MKVLVIGGSGFLGGFVVPQLLSGGHEVLALARSAAAADRVESLGATPVPGDLESPTQIDAAFAAASGAALVNLASLGFGHAPTIVAAAETAGLRRAVFVSTTAIFTSLPAPSRIVRLAAEATITDSALEWTILRPTMIYGAPGDRNMERLLRLLRRSPMVPLPGGGNRLQQPVHVEDLALAVVAALERPSTACHSYDLAGPTPLTLREVVGQVAAAIGRTPLLVPMPLGPVIRAVRFYERIAARPRLRAEQIERLAEDKAFDVGPARRDLAFDPRPFSQGIRDEAALLW